MMITILVIVRSPQSHLIFVPFKTDFLNVLENFALLTKDFFFKRTFLKHVKKTTFIAYLVKSK